MKNIVAILFLVMALNGFSQKEKLHLIEGNQAYASGNYIEAENKYLDAITTDPNYIEGNFNLGDALFRQEKYEDAARYFNHIAETAPDTETKAKAYHNLGNSMLKAQKLGESINAYKQALKLNPQDDETRYNLSYALKMQQQQQQQQQNQKNNQNQDQENKEQQDKQDQQDQQDQQQQDQDKQNQEQNQEQQQDQQQQDQGNQNEEQQNQQQGEMQKGDKISKEDADRMLEALQLQEKNTQEKLKKQRLKNAQKIKIEKDW